MATVIPNLEARQPGGRNAALNHAVWTLGRRIAAGALEQADVEDALYAAAVANGTWSPRIVSVSVGRVSAADWVPGWRRRSTWTLTRRADHCGGGVVVLDDPLSVGGCSLCPCLGLDGGGPGRRGKRCRLKGTTS
jgi:hypothetical protein